MAERKWIDVGAAAELGEAPIRRLEIAGLALALSYDDGTFAALSAVCAHKGGPLDQGTLVDGCIVCPWHNWKYDRVTGQAVGRPAGVDAYAVEVRDGRVLIDVASGRGAAAEAVVKHPLERPIVREPGPLRVVGISTTVMNRETPRYSTSERLLGVALDHASAALGAETRLLKLNDLRFRNCEGYYSKSAHVVHLAVHHHAGRRRRRDAAGLRRAGLLGRCGARGHARSAGATPAACSSRWPSG